MSEFNVKHEIIYNVHINTTKFTDYHLQQYAITYALTKLSKDELIEDLVKYIAQCVSEGMTLSEIGLNFPLPEGSIQVYDHWLAETFEKVVD